MALFYGYGFGYYFDPTYILVIIGVVLTLLASARVQTTFAKYSKIRSLSGYTGAEAAQRILRSAGIYDVSVQRVGGNLTDHYDPRRRIR
jgi:Zn-dependent membrane protease YugP